MIPEKRSPIVEIPLTFDSHHKPQGLSNDKFLMTALVFGIWLFIAIFTLFLQVSILEKVLVILGGFGLAFFISHVLILKGPYFKKKREDLLEHNYQYPYSMFWNIYEIPSNKKAEERNISSNNTPIKSVPTICRYANGLKSMFVVFDKDVIVGKDVDAEYYHHQAIADAYLQMAKRGIDCIHIDYMDTIGKDGRVSELFNSLNDCPNKDLKNVLVRIYENVEFIMQHSYASYDVYCFFYGGKDDIFVDEMDVVLEAFLNANYIRYRILDRDAIGELVKSIYNIEEFSVKESCENLFNDIGGTHYLTPIWVERKTSKGVERVDLNKTSAQKEAERKTRNAEKVVKKHGRRKNKELKNNLENFMETEDYNNQGYYPENNSQEYYPENNNQGYYPENNSQEYYPENNNQEYYPENNNQEYYPENNNQEYYPENNQEYYSGNNNEENYFNENQQGSLNIENNLEETADNNYGVRRKKIDLDEEIDLM